MKQNQDILDLDSILKMGDQVYKTTVENLKRDNKFKNMLLNLNEVPSALEIGDNRFRVEKRTYYLVLLFKPPHQLDFSH